MNRRYLKIRKKIIRKRQKHRTVPVVLTVIIGLTLPFLPMGYHAQDTQTGQIPEHSQAAVPAYAGASSYEGISRVELNSRMQSSESSDGSSLSESSMASEYNDTTSSESRPDGDNEHSTSDINTEETFFDGALFLGDSLTEGLAMHANLPHTTFYAHKGLNVETALSKAFINENGQTVTIPAALQEHKFTKVYLMFGVNELGWDYSSIFVEKYRSLVEEVQTAQPQAQIIIQSILPVSKKKSESDPCINNTRIEQYNELLRKMAAELDVIYLPVNQSIMNALGCLPDDASVDGVHLNEQYCHRWLEAVQALSYLNEL